MVFFDRSAGEGAATASAGGLAVSVGGSPNISARTGLLTGEGFDV